MTVGDQTRCRDRVGAGEQGGSPRHVVLIQEGCDLVTGLAVGKPHNARLLLRSNGKVWGNRSSSALSPPPVSPSGSIRRQIFMGCVTITPAGSQ